MAHVIRSPFRTSWAQKENEKTRYLYESEIDELTTEEHGKNVSCTVYDESFTCTEPSKQHSNLSYEENFYGDY